MPNSAVVSRRKWSQNISSLAGVRYRERFTTLSSLAVQQGSWMECFGAEYKKFKKTISEHHQVDHSGVGTKVCCKG
jgi:hypothetical protein